jgi:hypothetical protein
MKKFFQKLDYTRIFLYIMLGFFIIGLFINILDLKREIAEDHIIMIILTITLIIKDYSIVSHKKLIDSYKLLVDNYDIRSDHQREIIAMLKNTIQLRNDTIAEIHAKKVSKYKAQTADKNDKK